MGFTFLFYWLYEQEMGCLSNLMKSDGRQSISWRDEQTPIPIFER